MYVPIGGQADSRRTSDFMNQFWGDEMVGSMVLLIELREPYRHLSMFLLECISLMASSTSEGDVPDITPSMQCCQ
jgi:hypothetical protein